MNGWNDGRRDQWIEPTAFVQGARLLSFRRVVGWIYHKSTPCARNYAQWYAMVGNGVQCSAMAREKRLMRAKFRGNYWITGYGYIAESNSLWLIIISPLILADIEL